MNAGNGRFRTESRARIAASHGNLVSVIDRHAKAETPLASGADDDWSGNALREAELGLVPSSLLAQQWEREIRSELADLDVRLLRVGGEGGSKRWGNLLTTFSLLANGFQDSVTFLEKLETALAAKLPEVKFKHYNKGDVSIVVTDEMLSSIASECSALVCAYGH